MRSVTYRTEGVRGRSAVTLHTCASPEGRKTIGRPLGN